MKGIGIVLVIVGSLLMYNGFQESQTFGARFNNAIGNSAGNRGVGLDMIVGFVFALGGAALITKASKKS